MLTKFAYHLRTMMGGMVGQVRQDFLHGVFKRYAFGILIVYDDPEVILIVS